MSTFFQKFLAFFSATPAHLDATEPAGDNAPHDGMPLAGPTYLRQFAHRLGLEVDDLSPAEQTELKRRLDDSMDFREENYDRLYHGVYRLGHGYSLADAERVSAQINEICAEDAAQAYLDYRENSIAAEALMAAASVLQNEGQNTAAERLFNLADARRHRSSRLAAALDNGSSTAVGPNTEQAQKTERAFEKESASSGEHPGLADGANGVGGAKDADIADSTDANEVTEVTEKSEPSTDGLAGLMVQAPTKQPKAKPAKPAK